MDYEKKYKEALERARKINSGEGVEAPPDWTVCEVIFPELKESEDERIRKWIIDDIRYNMNNEPLNNSEYKKEAEKAIAWLEKQAEHKDYYTKQELIDMGFSFTLNGDIVTPDEMMEDMKKYLAWKEKQSEQKPADKVGPKFKVGDWITNGRYNKLIVGINSDWPFYMFKDGTSEHIKDVDKKYHLWAIQDAKDGDVLAYVTGEEDLWIMIYRSLYEPYEGHVHYHALLVNNDFSDKGTCCICIDDLKPATKEQRDTLIAKMTEAGYVWDAEKKELRKTEDEEYNGEDYGIDSLFHAQRILEKTLGKVDGYQTDDGILSHMCAISAVKKLYGQKSVEWTEEDESKVEDIVYFLNAAKTHYASTEAIDDCVAWLESLKPQKQWKPSKEQIDALEHFVRSIGESDYASPYDNNTKLLYSLLEQLKKL
jgi:hypothetical protein